MYNTIKPNNNIYHYNDRSKTYSCIVVKIHMSKRTMLSRTVMNKAAMVPKDAKQIGRSVLSFAKVATDPEMVTSSQESGKTVTANPFITIKVHDYIIDKANIGGTSTIETNFIAAFAHQNKQMVYLYNQIVPVGNNVKGAQIRSLVECF